MTDQATCPQCGSTSIQAVPVPKKNLGNAVLAEYFLGTAAGVSAGSSTVIQAVCLKCGCQYFPGTVQEKQIRALSGQLGEVARKAEVDRRESEREEARKSSNMLIGVVGVLAVVVVVAVAVSSISEQSAENSWRIHLADSLTTLWTTAESTSLHGRDRTVTTWNQYSVLVHAGGLFLRRIGCGESQFNCQDSRCRQIPIAVHDAVEYRFTSYSTTMDERISKGDLCQ